MIAKEKIYKSNKGITIIALVITVIILLMLASVTFSTLTSEDGIIETTEKQREDTLEMAAKQEVEVAAEKVKLANVSDIEIDVNMFSNKLEDKLQVVDGEAKVTSKETGEGYTVNYKGYTFDYYYDYLQVTLNPNGGTVTPDNKLVKYGHPYGDLPNATRAGYEFSGWYTALSGGTKVIASTKVTNTTNHTLYSLWSANTDTPYTVKHYKEKLDGTYELADTDNLTGITDTKVTLETKTYEGFTSPETQEIIIKGEGTALVEYNYTRNSYTLTYNANGGTVNPTSTRAKYEEGITLPTPTRTHTVTYNTNGGTACTPSTVSYTFNGWYTGETNGTKIEYTKMPAYDETLYAQWTSSSIALPTSTKAGYAFDGWYTDSSLNTAVPLTSGKYTPTTNVTLYAKWLANTDTPYTVKHYKEKLDGTYELVDTENLTGITDTKVTPETRTYEGFTSPEAQEITIKGDGTTLVEYKYTRNTYTLTLTSSPTEGGTVSGGGSKTYGTSCTVEAQVNSSYVFEGWYEGDTKVSLDATYSFNMPANDYTLQAKFTEVKYYTVTINKGTGISSVSGAGQYKAGQSVTISASVLSSSSQYNYSWSGWTGDTSVLSNTGTQTQTFTMPAHDVTLTANGTASARSYILTVTASPSAGGTVSGGGSKTYGTWCTVNARASSSYLFEGWYEGSTLVSSNASYSFSMPARNRSLVARFKLNKVTLTVRVGDNISSVTLDGKSSSSSVSKEYTPGTSVSISADVESNCTWNGWTSSNSSLLTAPTSQSTNITIPTGDVTLTANAELDGYEVIAYNGDSAKTYHVIWGAFSESASRAGCEFVGWSKTKSTSNYSKSVNVTSDMTLYAVFRRKVRENISNSTYSFTAKRDGERDVKTTVKENGSTNVTTGVDKFYAGETVIMSSFKTETVGPEGHTWTRYIEWETVAVYYYTYEN